jgi:DNA-directed RNA polymerase subunit RPC12/RpoP
MRGTPNRPCSKCGETYATGFDITEDDTTGRVYELRYLVCDYCGHETAPRRKYLGTRPAEDRVQDTH